MTEQGSIKTKLYSPLQVAMSAFVGGPFAGVYVLKKNFDALSDRTGSQQAMIWGSVLIVVMAVTIPFLPKKTPHYIIPLAYSVGARMIAEKYQMSKQAIHDSGQYGFRSNWNVLGISVASLVGSFALFALWMFGLDALGIIHLDDY
jgi:predicted MFS family arabinose efflux permease